METLRSLRTGLFVFEERGEWKVEWTFGNSGLFVGEQAVVVCSYRVHIAIL